MKHDTRHASDHEYADRVRDVEAETLPALMPMRADCLKPPVARENWRCLRCDWILSPAKNQQVFYIGSNDTGVLDAVRRHMLSEFSNLPVAGEYLHRDIFDIAEMYGKDTFVMIDKLGTDKMPLFFTLKGRVDAR